MIQKIIHVGLDVDDVRYHGSAMDCRSHATKNRVRIDFFGMLQSEARDEHRRATHASLTTAG